MKCADWMELTTRGACLCNSREGNLALLKAGTLFIIRLSDSMHWQRAPGKLQDAQYRGRGNCEKQGSCDVTEDSALQHFGFVERRLAQGFLGEKDDSQDDHDMPHPGNSWHSVPGKLASLRGRTSCCPQGNSPGANIKADGQHLGLLWLSFCFISTGSESEEVEARRPGSPGPHPGLPPTGVSVWTEYLGWDLR